MQAHCGNANELGDIGMDPGKSSLFFLTEVFDHEISLAGEMVEPLVEHRN